MFRAQQGRSQALSACLLYHCNDLNKWARHHSFHRRAISPLLGGRSRSSLVRGQDPFVTFDHLVPRCLAAKEAFSRHMRQVGESSGRASFLSQFQSTRSINGWKQMCRGRRHASIAEGRQGKWRPFLWWIGVSSQATRVGFS